MAVDESGTTGLELFEERIDDNRVVVRLTGDVDLHGAPHLRGVFSRLVDDGCDLLVVDLSGVTFLDSMTLGVLLGASKRLRQRGGQLRIVVSEPSVRRIFEITLLDRVFQLCESTGQALDREA